MKCFLCFENIKSIGILSSDWNIGILSSDFDIRILSLNFDIGMLSLNFDIGMLSKYRSECFLHIEVKTIVINILRILINLNSVIGSNDNNLRIYKLLLKEINLK